MAQTQMWKGFLPRLQNHNRDWSQTVAVILGNGGAARAVVAGCAQLGCAEIHIAGRDELKLKAFLNSWSGSTLAVKPQVHLWEELLLMPQLWATGRLPLLINTTPIGMYPNIELSPLNADQMRVPPGTIVYDLIYNPNPTQFLQQAQQQGAVIIDGLEMLVQQGAAALKIWLQQPVPVEVMRRSLQQHLGLLE